MALTLVVAVPAAYAIVRSTAGSSGTMFRIFLLGLAIPAQATIIPLYLIINRMQLYDSLTAIVLPTVAFGLPLVILVLVGSLRDVSNELYDAMTVDGAGPFRILWQLVIPMSRGSIAAVGTYTALGAWNQFLFPLILTQDPSRRVLTLGLQSYSNEFQINVPAMMMAVLLTALPVFVLYLRGAPVADRGPRRHGQQVDSESFEYLGGSRGKRTQGDDQRHRRGGRRVGAHGVPGAERPLRRVADDPRAHRGHCCASTATSAAAPGAGERAGLVDLVFNDLDSPWAVEIIRGVEDVAHAAAVGTVVSAIHRHSAATRQWLENLRARESDGVILVTSTLQPAHQAELRRLNVPAVVIDPAGGPALDVPTIGATNWAGGPRRDRAPDVAGPPADRLHRRAAVAAVQPGPPRRLPRRARRRGHPDGRGAGPARRLLPRVGLHRRRRADGPAEPPTAIFAVERPDGLRRLRGGCAGAGCGRATRPEVKCCHRRT